MPITPSAAPEVTLAPSLGRGGNPPRPAASAGEQVRSRPPSLFHCSSTALPHRINNNNARGYCRQMLTVSEY